jgi:hypothetical protein
MDDLGKMTLKEASSLVSFIENESLHAVVHSGSITRIDSFTNLLESMKEAESAFRQGSLERSLQASALSTINKPQETL